MPTGFVHISVSRSVEQEEHWKQKVFTMTVVHTVGNASLLYLQAACLA